MRALSWAQYDHSVAAIRLDRLRELAQQWDRFCLCPGGIEHFEDPSEKQAEDPAESEMLGIF